MKPDISFEFFPPNTSEGEAKLRVARRELARAAPEFFSVTFGAGGANRDKTFSTVAEIAAEGLTVAPHIAGYGSTAESVRELLGRYRALGIRRLVVLRGDLPSAWGVRHAGEFHFAADLVAFVRQQTGDWFHIEVAGYPEVHPQAGSPRADLEAFVAKVRAGANSAITQYFFNADAYFRFRDEVAGMGLDVPIVAGIMPITNFVQLARFSDTCGAEIPRWLRLRLADYGDDHSSIRALGLEVVARMCQRLVDGGAPGLHFYTLNRSEPSLALVDSLPLPGPGPA
ncbi:MAG: methylenetetrahydrofolate reductase [NAD(P)H] [Burkholderiaceae bacterium]|nr:methylenetetrahydrofolate reductase [NAD(P)H] [Burkholderiaceae bacterium]